MQERFEELLGLISELKAAVRRMNSRGERVPFEVEEKVHLIEELVEEGARLAKLPRVERGKLESNERF